MQPYYGEMSILNNKTPKSPISGFVHAVNCASHSGCVSERFQLECSIEPCTVWDMSRYNMTMKDLEKGVVVQVSFSTGGYDDPKDIEVPVEFQWTSDKERLKVAKCLYRYYRTWKNRQDQMSEVRKREAMENNRRKMASVYNN